MKAADEKLDDLATNEIKNKINSDKYLRKCTNMSTMEIDKKFENLMWNFIIKFKMGASDFEQTAMVLLKNNLHRSIMSYLSDEYA